MKLLLGLLLFLSVFVLNAGINFEKITLAQAKTKAKAEKKLIFIDTYASWCAPCKVMDKVFAEQHIGEYFNGDFVNVKIDMDGNQGQLMQNLYGVVWLPTLLVIDEYGEILMKLDKVVTPGELLDYVNEARTKRKFISGRGLNSNPFPQGSRTYNQQDYHPAEKEEVIYVYDARESSGRPHIMYHEAYLHLQLSDGKHRKVVKKYLSTQTDWSLEKNVRFIFDFMDDVNSDLFKYCINNRWRFEEVLGVQKVQESIGHLINQRIEQGYPRPELREYIQLYKYLDSTTGEKNAYKRYMNKMLDENQHVPFIDAAITYSRQINPSDHQVMYQLASLRQERSNAKLNLQDDIALLNNAILLSPENYQYLHFLSQLLETAGEKDQAISHLKSAILYAPKDVQIDYEQDLSRLEGL